VASMDERNAVRGWLLSAFSGAEAIVPVRTTSKVEYTVTRIRISSSPAECEFNDRVSSRVVASTT
jgi:hypothetical protein